MALDVSYYIQMKTLNETWKDYQVRMLSCLSDNEIILGMVRAYQRESCDAEHYPLYAAEGYLATDECRYFRYPDGQSDHYNMRWFKEWAQENRPQVLERLNSLKIFL